MPDAKTPTPSQSNQSLGLNERTVSTSKRDYNHFVLVEFSVSMARIPSGIQLDFLVERMSVLTRMAAWLTDAYRIRGCFCAALIPFDSLSERCLSV